MSAGELFFQRDPSEPPAVTRSRSRAAFYLNPTRLGHLVGMGVDGQRRGRAEVEAVLRDCGVDARSTKSGRRMVIDGRPTNVSLARYLRLFDLFAAVSAHAADTPAACCRPLSVRVPCESSSCSRHAKVSLPRHCSACSLSLPRHCPA